MGWRDGKSMYLQQTAHLAKATIEVQGGRDLTTQNSLPSENVSMNKYKTNLSSDKQNRMCNQKTLTKGYCKEGIVGRKNITPREKLRRRRYGQPHPFQCGRNIDKAESTLPVQQEIITRSCEETRQN